MIRTALDNTAAVIIQIKASAQRVRIETLVMLLTEQFHSLAVNRSVSQPLTAS